MTKEKTICAEKPGGPGIYRVQMLDENQMTDHA